MHLTVRDTQTLKAKTTVAPTLPLQCVTVTNKSPQYLANLPNGPDNYQTEITNIDVEIIPALTSEYQRQEIRYVSIVNPNTESHTVTITLTDSAIPINTRVQYFTLKQYWRAEYNVNEGWKIYNNKGTPIAIDESRIGKILAQGNPGAVLTNLFTASKPTFVNAIHIANSTNTSRTFRLSLAKGGAVDILYQYIAYNETIVRNDSKIFNNGIHLEVGDVIRVYGQTTDVIFNIIGEEIE
jgi:hypothetical protein